MTWAIYSSKCRLILHMKTKPFYSECLWCSFYHPLSGTHQHNTVTKYYASTAFGGLQEFMGAQVLAQCFSHFWRVPCCIISWFNSVFKPQICNVSTAATFLVMLTNQYFSHVNPTINLKAIDCFFLFALWEIVTSWDCIIFQSCYGQYLCKQLPIYISSNFELCLRVCDNFRSLFSF